MTRTDLLALAAENADTPLIILGHQVNKHDPNEVYGALIWIEEQLHARLRSERRQRTATPQMRG